MGTEEQMNALIDTFISRATALGITIEQGNMYPWGYSMFVFKNLTYNIDTKKWCIAEVRSNGQACLSG